MKTTLAILIALSFALFNTALAQDKYPTKPITMIIALGPGTIQDLVGRVVSEPLRQELKTDILFEYKTGAAGVIGSDFVAKSKPDGYTLGSLNGPSFTNAAVITPNLPYDPIKDFTPLANVGVTTALIAVNSNSPWKTLDEFVSHAKKNPGKVSCGTSGVGSSGHFNLELLNLAAGVQINHVPYKAGSPANVAALLGGHIDCASQIWPVVSSHVRAGTLRVLAVTRSIKEFPEFPTFAKFGFVRVNLDAWFGIFGPANLSQDVTAKLVPAVAKAVKDPESIAKLEKAGFTVAYEGPKELLERIKREYAVVRDVAQKAGIKPE
jgi:tripartite-type tricarboxylate transporter receptor subunit TctC